MLTYTSSFTHAVRVQPNFGAMAGRKTQLFHLACPPSAPTRLTVETARDRKTTVQTLPEWRTVEFNSSAWIEIRCAHHNPYRLAPAVIWATALSVKCFC